MHKIHVCYLQVLLNVAKIWWPWTPAKDGQSGIVMKLGIRRTFLVMAAAAVLYHIWQFFRHQPDKDM